MKVILNVDAIAPPLTGIGRYALALARGLAAASEVEDLRFFAGYRWVSDPEAALSSNRSLAAARRWLPFKHRALETYFHVRQWLFSQRTRRLHGFLLHSPNYLLFDHDGPTVTTVHDLSWVHYPEFHPRDRVRIMERRFPESLATATRVVTDSEFVRRELIERYGLPEDRIVAVPLGVDAAYRPMRADETAASLARLGLAHGGYLLSVATLEPRKNLDRLLDAYAALPDPVRARWPLVLAGFSGWQHHGLERKAAALIARGELVKLGYVDEAILPELYAGARAFVFVSVYEGFGLPPLEALASGVPAVVSNLSAMPEVVGDAAFQVAPEDAAAITAAIERVLTDERLRSDLVAAGPGRAAHYTWGKCVERTIAVYREAIRVA